MQEQEIQQKSSDKVDLIQQKIDRNLELLQMSAKTPDSYIIKRSYGNTIESTDLKAVIAFMNVMHRKPTNEDFLMAGMYYTYHNTGELTKNIIPFETLLSKLYKDSVDSTKRKIETFLQLSINESKRFAKLFRYMTEIISRKYGLYTIDYFKLYKDFYRWDKYDDIRKKWAMAVILPTVNKEKEKEV